MRIRSASLEATLVIFWTLIVFVLFGLAHAQQSVPGTPKSNSANTQTKGPSENGWPRIFSSGADTFTIIRLRWTLGMKTLLTFTAL